MGVYIKNITKERAERCLQFARDGWCIEEMPEIIELPPHGDLIDRDVLMRKKIRSVQSGSGENFTSWTISAVSVENIRNAPTIIEAEEGE